MILVCHPVNLLVMKKMMMFFLLMGTLVISNEVKAQKRGYYYYPGANTYYNPNTRQYAYEQEGNWSYHNTAPSNFDVRRQTRVTVYSNNQDVWRDNAMHREKYKDWDRKGNKKWKKRGHDQ